MKKLSALIPVLLTSLIFFQTCSKNDKDYLVTIHTRFGDMKIILYDQTPQHKKNFIKLAKDGYYDSLLFHRVINGFMIQTGGPDSRNAERGDIIGNGGPGYTIPAEFVPGLIHEKGAVAAARQGDNLNPKKESSGSQFYIVQGKVWTEDELKKSRIDFNKLYQYFGNLIESSRYRVLNDSVMQLQMANKTQELTDLIISYKDTVEKEYDVELDLPLTEKQLRTYTTVGGVPHLDGSYTVFGKVVDGLNVIDKIASVKTNANDRPVEDVVITVGVERIPRKKIEEMYHFNYPES